jgi:hypothetical protein
MTLENLRLLARAMIPGAKINVIPDTVLDLILNEGVKDIADYTVCLKTNKKFSVVADDSEYNLSVELGDYLTVDKPGLWWYNGSIWRPLWPRTLKWLDENKPNWRSLSSGTPLDYSIDADVLTISPPPQTSVTDGFWFYYGKKPTNMTQNTHYPFSGSTTELTHLSKFDMAIILYAKWKIEPMLNKKGDSNLSYQEYLREREEKLGLLNRRLDIAHSSDTRLQGPSIGR